eukprot:scaffold770_cov255-Pinguiococcus_pyrenoidosus.AAC.21
MRFSFPRVRAQKRQTPQDAQRTLFTETVTRSSKAYLFASAERTRKSAAAKYVLRMMCRALKRRVFPASPQRHESPKVVHPRCRPRTQRDPAEAARRSSRASRERPQERMALRRRSRDWLRIQAYRAQSAKLEIYALLAGSTAE